MVCIYIKYKYNIQINKNIRNIKNKGLKYPLFIILLEMKVVCVYTNAKVKTIFVKTYVNIKRDVL